MALTYEPIATTTLSSNSNTVTFTSISQAYTDIVLVGNFSISNNGSTIYFRVGNGSIDTGTNYSNTALYGTGTTAYSERNSNTATCTMFQSLGYSSGNLGDNNVIFHFMNYSNTTTNKTIIGRANNGGGSSYPGTGASVQLWRSTSAINQIQFTANSGTGFNSGSTFTLYGIKAA